MHNMSLHFLSQWFDLILISVKRGEGNWQFSKVITIWRFQRVLRLDASRIWIDCRDFESAEIWKYVEFKDYFSFTLTRLLYLFLSNTTSFHQQGFFRTLILKVRQNYFRFRIDIVCVMSYFIVEFIKRAGNFHQTLFSTWEHNIGILRFPVSISEWTKLVGSVSLDNTLRKLFFWTEKFSKIFREISIIADVCKQNFAKVVFWSGHREYGRKLIWFQQVQFATMIRG